ncbi:unnamed protein product, partial [Ixodes hexagonus]
EHVLAGKTQLQPASRSQGDGMEDDGTTASLPPLRSPYSSPPLLSFPKDIPVPVKRREPKFVPYEPYKAAVTPIVPPSTAKKGHRQLAALEIPFPLLRDGATGKRGSHPSPVISVVREVPEGTAAERLIPERETAARLASLEKQLEILNDQKRDVEDQLRVQLQVNTELKKLLVASLGEDMQARVQFLSEDKAKLAEDISFYSAKLQEGMEEVDRLSIQSDVWRSKFLASSLMIDELAGWKARLMHQCEDFQESLQWIASEHQHLETNVVATYRLLSKLHEVLSPPEPVKSGDGPVTKPPVDAPPHDLLQLSAATQQLARAACQVAHGSANLRLLPAPSVVPTPAERFAQKAEGTFETLKRSFTPASTSNTTLPPGTTSEKCHHVNGKADHECATTLACCRHCSGHLETV